MRRNLPELPKLVELVAEWGVEKLWVQNLSHTFDDTDPSGNYADIRQYAEREALFTEEEREEAKRVFAEARARARALRVSLRLPRLEDAPAAATGRASTEPGCDWPWRSSYIAHDGKVQPCCMVMGSDRATLGDVTVDKFSDVWRNDAYAEFRARLFTDHPPDVCAGCSMYRGVF
jgi:radical SAM protein with 4Fe4S-binding SPASM domain